MLQWMLIQMELQDKNNCCSEWVVGITEFPYSKIQVWLCMTHKRQKNADLPAGYCECVPRILKGVYATGTLHTVTSNINFYWNSNYVPIAVKEGTTLTIKGFIQGRLYVILQPILKRKPISHCNLQTFTGKDVTYSINPSLWISNWWITTVDEVNMKHYIPILISEMVHYIIFKTITDEIEIALKMTKSRSDCETTLQTCLDNIF